MAEQSFRFVVTSKGRHGELWRLSKKMGSQTALANHLGVHQSEMCAWVNLRRYPAESTWERILDKFLLLSSQSYDDLWPAEVRAAIKGGKIGQQIEMERDIGLLQIAAAFKERNLLPAPDDAMIAEEDKQEDVAALNEVLRTLTYREREVLKLRRGIPAGATYTLEETGRIFKISKERIRQIESRAMRKLETRLRRLKRFADAEQERSQEQDAADEIRLQWELLESSRNERMNYDGQINAGTPASTGSSTEAHQGR